MWGMMSCMHWKQTNYRLLIKNAEVSPKGVRRQSACFPVVTPLLTLCFSSCQDNTGMLGKAILHFTYIPLEKDIISCFRKVLYKRRPRLCNKYAIHSKNLSHHLQHSLFSPLCWSYLTALCRNTVCLCLGQSPYATQTTQCAPWLNRSSPPQPQLNPTQPGPSESD